MGEHTRIDNETRSALLVEVARHGVANVRGA